MKACALVFGLAAALALAGCGPKEPAKKATPKEVVLAAGTEVPLVLLKQISAGSTREGTLVPFMVAEEVKGSDGSVLIEKGAVAEGEVAWSRSEGTLSGLMNQPARLTVRIRHTRASDGGSVKLAVDPEKLEEPYAFTRENTGIDDARISSETMVKLSNSDVAKRLEEAIDGFFETGDASKLNLEAEANQWLRTMTRQNDMRALEASLDSGGTELEKVVRHLKDGSITKLAGGEMLLAVSAMEDLARLGSSISNGLFSKLKGRTIKAYVGTKVKAYVGADAKVKVGLNS